MGVSDHNAVYNEHKQDWDQVRDCMQGERAIKAQGTLYLPKLTGMTDEEYRAFTKKVHFFGATARVADGLHGQVFSKPPQISGNIPDELHTLLKNNVDLMDTSLDQFASDIVWDAMMTNWGCILVDYSKGAEQVSLLEAEKRGYGAFMKWYPAESLINWRYDLVNGKEQLVLVVLHEPYTEPNPEDYFTETSYNRYRVLRLERDEQGQYGRYVQDIYDDKIGLDVPSETNIEVVMNGEYLYYLPVFTVPGKLPEKSMLLDLSFLNIGHYQESADYQHGKHYTAIPTPIATGVTPEADPQDPTKAKAVYIGGTKFIFFNNETGATIDVKFLEFSGSGMSALKDGINLTETQMAIMGAHIISAEKKGVETAAVAGIHRQGENGVLGAFVRNVSECITRAVKVFAEWNGYAIDGTDFSYNLNAHYELAEQNAQILSVLLQGRSAGEFPKIVLYRFLQRIEAIPEDWTFDMFLEEADKDAAPDKKLELDRMELERKRLEAPQSVTPIEDKPVEDLLDEDEEEIEDEE